MDGKVWKFIAVVNMIGLVLIIMIFIFAMKDGNSCLTNPLIYGAQKLTTEGPLATGGVTCQCTFKNHLYDPFTFNQDNISVLNSNRQPATGDPNETIVFNFTK